MTINLSLILKIIKFYNKIIIINDDNSRINLLKFNDSFIYSYIITKNNNIFKKGLIDYYKIYTLIDIKHINKIIY